MARVGLHPPVYFIDHAADGWYTEYTNPHNFIGVTIFVFPKRCREKAKTGRGLMALNEFTVYDSLVRSARIFHDRTAVLEGESRLTCWPPWIGWRRD